MKKYIANAILIIFTLAIIITIIAQIGSPIIAAYKEHGLIGLFATLFVLLIIAAIFIAIIKLLFWAIDNID